MRRINNLLFMNLMLLAAWGILRRGILDIFSIVVIILLVFILPGLGWLGLFIKTQRRSFVEGIFFIFLISTVAMLIGNCLLVWLKLQQLEFAYIIYLAIVINVGVLCSGNYDFKFDPALICKDHKKMMVVIVFLCIFIFVYFQAAHYIPPLPDSTLTVQEAAYGLWNYLKPYTFSDDGFQTYYFAHPLLMNFYAANTIFLSGHLSEMKYYYDYSQIVNRIYEKGPLVGENFVVYTDPKNFQNATILDLRGDEVVLDQPLPQIYLSSAFPRYIDELLKEEDLFEIRSYYGNELLNTENKGGAIRVRRRSPDKHIITKTLYEQIRLRILHDALYKEFYSSPHILCSRIINIFFVMGTLMIMMALLVQFGLSYQEALLLLLVYISLPEMNMQLIGGSRTALSSFCLIAMAYFYLTKNIHFTVISGIISGLSTHKLVFLPLAALLHRYLFRMNRFPALPLVFGFFGGLFAYWIYAMGIDAKVFFMDHIQFHLLNRIFHVDDLGYVEYPNFLNYWKNFIANVSWPFILISLFPLLLLFREKNNGRNIFVLWFLSGATIYSIVDWKETKHLGLIVIPLIFGIANFMNILKARKNIFFSFCRICIIIILFAIITIHLHGFASNDGNQMLKRIGFSLPERHNL